MKKLERAAAIALRREGASYQAILQSASIAKSTLWRWLKAEGLVETHPQRLTELRRRAIQKAASLARERRLKRTKILQDQAAQDIGVISARDLFVIGAALYWAEGSKQKPHNVAQRVTFTNTDPTMLRVFMLWLERICHVGRTVLTFELCIHESANLRAAQRFWSSALQLPAERFHVRLKRHKVSPHRKNVGGGYVGLVRITVRQSAQLNRTIAGWIDAIRRSPGESANGKPSDFGSEYPGSIPGSPASMTGALEGTSQLADWPQGQARWWYGSDADESIVERMRLSTRRRP